MNIEPMTVQPYVFNRLVRQIAALTQADFLMDDPDIQSAMNEMSDSSKPISEIFVIPFTCSLYDHLNVICKMIKQVVLSYNRFPNLHAEINTNLMWAMTPAGDEPVTSSTFLLKVKEEVELSARFLALADKIKGKEENSKFNACLRRVDGGGSGVNITVVIDNNETPDFPTILLL